jgi:hypothetical protein
VVEIWIEKPGISSTPVRRDFAPIGWGAQQNTTATGSQAIVFDFDQPVLELLPGDITVEAGHGEVTRGNLRRLTENSMEWALDVVVLRAGNVLVSIDKPGIRFNGITTGSEMPREVDVEFFAAPLVAVVNMPTVDGDGGERTERINITFAVPVALTIGNIVIASLNTAIGSDVTNFAPSPGTLSGSGRFWTLVVNTPQTAYSPPGGGNHIMGIRFQGIPGMAPQVAFQPVVIRIPTPVTP